MHDFHLRRAENVMTDNRSITKSRNASLYPAAWRWHFYAGVFVIPFLLTLCVSGLLMLVSKASEPLLYQELMYVQPQESKLPATTLLASVREAYPEAEVQLYIPPREISESARFALLTSDGAGHAGHDKPSTTVFLNPYTGDILGVLDPAKTPYARLKAFHSTLFIGGAGETLIEIAAGLSVLLVLNGLFLAWSRRGGRTGVSFRVRPQKREDWRKLHLSVGLVIALPLLFFLLSGLAWTNIWGGKLVQPWSSLPGTTFKAAEDDHAHHSMNHTGLHQVPWAIEQTPLPLSTGGEGNFDLDDITLLAKQHGFTNFRVHLPQSKDSVWTISATTIAGDLQNPQAERTLHLDASDGHVLADLNFADYPPLGKAMAAFIPLHQGDLGLWNMILNGVFISMVIVAIVSSIILWRKRNPTGSLKLNPPTASPTATKRVFATMLLISACFPLSAVALVVAMVSRRKSRTVAN